MALGARCERHCLVCGGGYLRGAGGVRWADPGAIAAYGCTAQGTCPTGLTCCGDLLCRADCSNDCASRCDAGCDDAGACLSGCVSGERCASNPSAPCVLGALD